MISATISPCVRRLVLQHRLADEIADRPDILHRGAALVVDLHEAARHVDGHVLQAPAFGVRLAADGDEDLVGGKFDRLAVFGFDGERPAVLRAGLSPSRPDAA